MENIRQLNKPIGIIVYSVLNFIISIFYFDLLLEKLKFYKNEKRDI